MLTLSSVIICFYDSTFPELHFQTFRRQVRELGECGVNRGRPISLKPSEAAAAEWMQRQELASFNSKGKLVLNSSALTFVTTLSQPKKVKDPIDPLNRSLWSLRRCLTAAGWTQGVSGKHASIEEKCFNSKSEHHAYFAILLQRTRADDYVYAFCFLHNLDCKRCGAMFFLVICNAQPNTAQPRKRPGKEV